MDDFSTAEPGQKLWSLRFGEVEVVSLEDPSFEHRGRVRCKWPANDGTSYQCWEIDGHPPHTCVPRFLTPDLYWSRPKIIAPPRPKRKGKRKVWFVHAPPLDVSHTWCFDEDKGWFPSSTKFYGPIEIEVEE